MTDLISRSAVLKDAESIDWYRINQNGRLVSGSNSDDVSYVKYDDVVRMLGDAPSLDVAPMIHAKWEKVSEWMPIYRCSECKERNLFRNGDNVLSNFCPQCGAKMDS